MRGGKADPCVANVRVNRGGAFAACPGERDDGKRVTVTGKIVYGHRDGGKRLFGLEECHIVVELKSKASGACRIGRTATVTGKFFSCDANFECISEDGDNDVIEASKMVCP